MNKSKAAINKKLAKLMSSTNEKPMKVIRDSFTLPESDHQLISGLQERSLYSRLHSTKGEVLRAGLHALVKMDDDTFFEYINNVEKLKPGRPKKIK